MHLTRLDGGLATTLQEQGLATATPVESWLFTHPSRIVAAHRAFVDAGAQILLTATFRSLPSERTDWRACVDAAVTLAREAAGDRAKVWLSLGPGAGHAEVVQYALRRVDGVVLETFVDPEALHSALVEVVASANGLPVVPSTVPSAAGGARSGNLVEHARLALDAGAIGYGVNCMPGPAVVEAASQLAGAGIPVWAKPNGGAELSSALAGLKPHCRWLGGCCGTTPSDLAALDG